MLGGLTSQSKSEKNSLSKKISWIKPLRILQVQ
nr:MAG TPA: hypothetical protein [Caudoviricetes sp.]DAY34085.1 MAG TPA: hypothetical protein [Caudoviricetes sp.]